MKKPILVLLLFALILALGHTSGAASVTLVPEELVVVVGVPAALEAEVRETAAAILEDAGRPYRFVALDELGAVDSPPDGEYIVALGADACERAVAAGRPSTCALLSAEAFAAVACSDRCDEVRAVVMDQPLSRQIAVARAVYPSLRRFGVLSADDEPPPATLPDGASVAFRRFRDEQPLPNQLDATLAASDALVALPESSIFNRSSLHVVLLTAYGYAKPVIGFGRAYVRAGALISAYSTPEQILREVLIAETRTSRAEGADVDTPRVRPPARFSIAENPRIARSLGLVRRVEIDPARAYSDGDFTS